MSKNKYPIPKGFRNEKGWRKLMANQTTVKINGQSFKLQSVSPSWYFGLSDDCKMGTEKRDTVKYMDTLFKNTVIEPKELASDGMDYFDNREDIETAEKLVGEIERFLRSRKQPNNSVSKSETE